MTVAIWRDFLIQDWSSQQIRLVIVVTWVFPMLAALPQLGLGFDYMIVNNTGGVIPDWTQPHWEVHY